MTIYQWIGNLSNQSKKTQFEFSTKEIVAIVSATINSTGNVQEDIDLTPTYYQQAPTMFFVIAGLASMLFLIVIAIALLCYSHYINHSQSQIEMRSQSTSSINQYSEDDSRNSFSQWSSPETPHHTTPILFVCNPGESKPTCFAQVAPMLPDDTTLCEHVNYINGSILFFQTSGLLTPTSIESMPMNPLHLQPQTQFQNGLVEENLPMHNSTSQPLGSAISVISHIPLPSNNKTLNPTKVDNDEINGQLHTKSFVTTTSKDTPLEDLPHLQSQQNLLQNVDAKPYFVSTCKAALEHSTNVIAIPTQLTLQSKFKEQGINIVDERPHFTHTTIKPSTSCTTLFEQELQQNKESQSLPGVQSAILEPISVIVHNNTSKQTNLASTEHMLHIVESSTSNLTDVLPVLQSLAPQEIPTILTLPFVEQKSQGSSNVHEENLMQLLEPSVNVITHSKQ